MGLNVSQRQNTMKKPGICEEISLQDAVNDNELIKMI